MVINTDKRRIISIQKVADDIGHELCNALPALYAYSGCNTTSSFVRKGKLLPEKHWRNILKYPKIIPRGQTPEVDECIQ